jgi:hypothetical protein
MPDVGIRADRGQHSPDHRSGHKNGDIWNRPHQRQSHQIPLPAIHARRQARFSRSSQSAAIGPLRQSGGRALKLVGRSENVRREIRPKGVDKFTYSA